MKEPFEFPRAFWFGWSLCEAAGLIALGIAFAVTARAFDFDSLFGPFHWLVPMGLWYDAALYVRNAHNERRCQIKFRHRAP